MESPTSTKQPRGRGRWRKLVTPVALVAIAVGGAILVQNSVTQSSVPMLALERGATPLQIEQPPVLEPTQSPSLMEEPTTIAPSAVTELYVPAEDEGLTINHQVFQMPTSCETIIEPPLGTPDQGEVFQCGDFALPSTGTTENVVLAGHSGRGVETVFNRLYPQGASLVDRSVFLRTVSSGDHWLEYRVQAVYEPAKSELPYMAEVWQPTPGRLILVTCLQEDGLQESVRNFVVVAEFVGVRASQ